MTFPPADLDIFKNVVGDGASVLVSTHIHPDPDAIGSALAAAEIVKRLGGVPTIVLEDKVPERCRFLPGAETIISYPASPVTQRFDVAVIVDAGGLSRIGQVEELLAVNARLINIDHHLSNDRFGSINFVSLDCAATAELLYLLCRELDLVIDPEIAANLFAGLLTDTGRFRYSNTTTRTLHIASELAAAGADVTRITNGLYFDIPEADIRSMSVIYSTLELFAGGQISTMFVKREQLVEDPDTIVDLALSVRGVRTAALLSETFEEKIRVSLRSRDTVNVARIAEKFGGGGHERAAGFRMKGTLESVRERLLPELMAALNDRPSPTEPEQV
ncbi:MAG: DHH family phosphoesterase [Calditrichota bacterium]